MTLEVVALADFGSTFTKLTLVEAATGRRVASAASPTTVASDVMEGYATALEAALGEAGEPCNVVDRLAASSAGGGLRVAAIGLVDDYTAAAARQAALNAGAKVELVLTGQLQQDDLAALGEARPDIVLFSGGTDGGQSRHILANADALAETQITAHVLVACNCDVAPTVAARLEARGVSALPVANVLPAIDQLDIEPARAAMRELFIEHVIMGKGLSETQEFGRAVVMPTPEAVLVATQLLSKGPGGKGGWGDLLVADIGGATTDVHSSIRLHRLPIGITPKGLPPLPLARSVQGDLGMRWNAPTVLEADTTWIAGQAGESAERLEQRCRERREAPDYLAATRDEAAFDRLLAVSCLTHALGRHCGRISTVYVPGQGARFVQEGLDLRALPTVIGTGGMLVRDEKGAHSLELALERREKGSLIPDGASIVIDTSYILAAAGLLASRHPDLAFHLMTSELTHP
ncbi:MAG: hypothetical protein HOI34_15885 [Rhodospirillaceae bacterium]|nr:hypothetical protein [Rhodospirillaceae bacterium]MBT6510658.1 hypothetical protein [Rhodospirillaceae bacterium]